jgi:hypothetical protein
VEVRGELAKEVAGVFDYSGAAVEVEGDGGHGRSFVALAYGSTHRRRRFRRRVQEGRRQDRSRVPSLVLWGRTRHRRSCEGESVSVYARHWKQAWRSW